MARKLYTGRLVDVSFDGEVCEHAAVCVTEMPEVFDTSARPWINPSAAWSPEAAELLVATVGRCPSGALVIERPEQHERVDPSAVVVTDDPAQQRFEARVDGELTGFAEYLLSDGLITFTHTEVDPAFEGRGVGSALARGALDAVRAAGGRAVLPLCPFIKGWILRHPDYRDLMR